MWKWILGVFLVSLILLTIMIQVQLGNVAVTDVKPARAPVVPQAAEAADPGAEFNPNAPRRAVLSVEQERLMNRVPPVQEGPVKGDILVM
ncbi:MAG: hypothetical protein HQL20_06575 [Candidatus Omnitrophica bacterium]|nr:hypothetical protein [Candidatus Omnitrophota bacterium]